MKALEEATRILKSHGMTVETADLIGKKLALVPQIYATDVTSNTVVVYYATIVAVEVTNGCKDPSQVVLYLSLPSFCSKAHPAKPAELHIYERFIGDLHLGHDGSEDVCEEVVITWLD